MTLNLSDFGLTSFIDFTNDGTLTFDAQRRISAAPDSLGLVANFTQATDANKKLLSRSDNKENLAFQSQDLSSALWTKTACTATSNTNTFNGVAVADTVTATAGTATHGYFAAAGSVSGTINDKSYRQWITVKKGTHNFVQLSFFNGAFTASQAFANFNLDTGVIGTIGTAVTGSFIRVNKDDHTYYDIGIESAGVTTALSGAYVILVPSNTAVRAQTWDATGAETIIVANTQYQAADADITMLVTTDYPQYAGVNGKPVAVCNGAQEMNTVTTMADFITGTDALLYAVVQPFETAAANRYIIRSSSGARFSLGSNVNKFTGYDFDGVLSTPTNSGATTPNLTYLVRYRKTGGSNYIAIDTGAGFTESAPVTMGATGLINTYRIGDITSGFIGKIAAIATANTGAAKPNLENLLRDYFFAKSMMQWDPLQADLALKKR